MSRTFHLTLSFCAIGLLYCNSLWGLDLTARVGAHGGTITKPKTSSQIADTKLSFGGVLTGVSINHGVSRNLNSYLDLSILADVTSSQIARKGIGAGVGYSLIGGPLSLIKDSAQSTATWSNQHSLSLLLSGGYFSYTVSDPDKPEQSIAGSTAEISAGIEAWQSFWGWPIGIQVSSQVLVLPAGVERVQPKGSEFVFIMHFTL